MLFGDSAKFYGILLGLGFASLLIAQQASIFVGLMSRTFAFVGEIGHVDLWVFDPTQSFVDDQKPLRSTAIDRVRGVKGVAWAAPLYKSLLVVTLPNGVRRSVDVIGIDADTLAGGPVEVVAGSLADLRLPDAIMVEIGSSKASRISWEVIVSVFGRPATRSRPFTSMVASRSKGYAEPILILMSSAVRSPIIRL